MSYKDDLELQKKMAEEAEAKAAAERKEKYNELVRRATELETHIASKDPSAIGLTIERNGARVSLKGEGITIVIDADLKLYNAMVLVPSKRGIPAPEIAPGSQTRLMNIDDVDKYILKMKPNG